MLALVVLKSRACNFDEKPPPFGPPRYMAIFPLCVMVEDLSTWEAVALAGKGDVAGPTRVGVRESGYGAERRRRGGTDCASRFRADESSR